jgi:uncharacterized protein (UPF0261 family)
MTKTIAIVGALDTKEHEFAFVKAAVQGRGHQALMIDCGVVGDPLFAPDVGAAVVAEADFRSELPVEEVLE